MTTTTEIVRQEIREEPGEILKPIDVLLLVQDNIRNRIDSISHSGPLNLKIQN